MTEDVRVRIEGAREAVDRATRLLTDPTPESLEACMASLQAAVAGLQMCRSKIERQGGDAALLSEAKRVREGVHLAGALLERAADHRARWFEILRSMTGGYTAQGDPAEFRCAARVSLKG